MDDLKPTLQDQFYKTRIFKIELSNRLNGLIHILTLCLMELNYALRSRHGANSFGQINRFISSPIHPVKPKYYVIGYVSPTPSGAGLYRHPGLYCFRYFPRYKMQGHEVLHPDGLWFVWFAVAEQYAIQRGIHPEKATNENIARYRAPIG